MFLLGIWYGYWLGVISVAAWNRWASMYDRPTPPEPQRNGHEAERYEFTRDGRTYYG